MNPVTERAKAVLKALAEKQAAKSSSVSEAADRAWSFFLDNPLPDQRQEAWLYSQWQPWLNLIQATTAVPCHWAQPDLTKSARERLTRHIADLPDNHFVIAIAQGRWLPALSRLPTDGSVRLEDDADHVQAASWGDGLEAWHRYCCRRQLRIRIAEGTYLPQPLQVVYDHEGDGSVLLENLAVHVGANSEVTCVETRADAALSSSHKTHHRRSEIHLAANSRLTLIDAQCWSPNTWHHHDLTVHQASDSRYAQHRWQWSGAWQKVHTHLNLQESGAEADCYGLMVGHDSQYLDQWTRVIHNAPHTRSQQHVRSILQDRAVGACLAGAVIQPAGDDSQATQHSHNLLLSPGARMNTKPELEIYADNVRCNHGATVGQLDAEALFYLQSRGIPAVEARWLLIQAFMQVITDACPMVDLAQKTLRDCQHQLRLEGDGRSDDLPSQPASE